MVVMKGGQSYYLIGSSSSPFSKKFLYFLTHTRPPRKDEGSRFLASGLGPVLKQGA